MNIDVLDPIAIRAIDLDLVQRAGQPGTPARVAVYHALEILSRSPCWAHGARGPHEFDWLGFVRETVHSVMISCYANGMPLADAVGYKPNPVEGLSINGTQLMVQDWGLKEIPADQAHPGDVILFSAGGGAHLAILLADKCPPQRTTWAAPAGTIGMIAQAAFARPPAQTWLTDEMMAMAVCAYTWPASI